MNPNQPPVLCARCGAALPARLPAGLCPKCLLAAGLGTQPQTGPEDTVIMPETASLRGFPQPGESFGHYRLVRLLGQGGMGVIFEAEDQDAGRRVALKILSQALDSPESRKRFLREGQIAASINHPNSVYVFGTEEIAGTPVIAMELVGGGTLRDQVMSAGPYSAAVAVDTILQIIAGLEAAQSAGVLHRDVKPSNCFIDSDGTVKIGDFGLSISTSVRTESNLTGAGSLFGTPAFSSPEQLRGEELTVRSDIYSVGVTLYYLLTGRMPFEAPNMVQLLVTVLERRPQSPDRLRAGIPEALGRAVLRCLHKDSSARFESYAALRRAVLPYASASPTPATLALRFPAWLADQFILGLISWVIFYTCFGGLDGLMNPDHKGRNLFASLFSALLIVIYYGLFEGLRGASPGKMLCRLRVVGPDASTPGWRRGVLRALIYGGFCALPQLVFNILGQDWIVKHPLGVISSFAFPLLLFCTCRRVNGFVGLHELWSRTRVLAQSSQPIRPALPPAPETPPVPGEVVNIGPYHVLAALGRSAGAEVVLGYDARLLRKVWLRRVSPATPPVALVLRHLARPGRFRWLNGGRVGDEAWDVYEAVSGQSLLALVEAKPAWEQVRFWLLDLAEELKAGEKDGSLPAVLGLDRVWITSDGRAKLLDFPAPGANLPLEWNQCPPANPTEFLHQTAASALAGCPLSVAQARTFTPALPLPLYTRGFFQRLGFTDDVSDAVTQLKLLICKRAAITPRHRLAMLVLTMTFPVFTAFMVVLGGYLMENHGNVDLIPLQMTLARLAPLEPAGHNASGTASVSPDSVRPFEIYFAGRFAPMITNSNLWNGFMARSLIPPEQRTLAMRLVAAHPSVTPAEFAAVKSAVESQYHLPPALTQPNPAPAAGFTFPGKMTPMLQMMLYISPIMYAVIPCFLAAILLRGGLVMQGLGIAVVGRNGRPSRFRTLRRNVVAWLPFLLSPLLVHALGFFMVPLWALVATIGVLGLLTVISLALRRSLQDRVAGTWLVPGGKMPADEVGSGTRWPMVVFPAAGVLVVVLLAFVPFYHWLDKTRGAGTSPANYLPAQNCVALLPDGTPAAGAQVWLGTNDNASVNCFRPGEYNSFNMHLSQTDASGRFSVPAGAGQWLVILTHPAGTMVTTMAAVQKNTRLQLAAFGRVNGLLLSEGKPRPGAEISLGDFHGPYGLDIDYSTQTGADGRFSFTNLVAGEYRLYRVFYPRRDMTGGFAVHPSHQMIVMVKSGETENLQWGGAGRSVTGRAVAANPTIPVNWLCGNDSLELTSATAGVTKFVRDSWGLGTSSAQELKEVHQARSYHLEMETDGSFHAEDVPPGKYELHLQVTKPGTGPNQNSEDGDVLGSLVRSVTVPAGSGAYDLGRQVVTVQGESGAAPAQPMAANFITLAGKPLTLSALRGKYVVLVFWASWSESSRNTLARLKPVTAEFPPGPRMTFIAASVDDDAETLPVVANLVPPGMTMCRLVQSDRVPVIETFDVNTLPAVFVLGPDGRLLARNPDLGRLTDLLRSELPTH
jgi:hypothetical protein